MLLAQQLREYIAACFTGIWIESHEHDDALAEIGRLCHDEGWQLARWNIAEGLQVPGIDAETGGSDPLAAIRAVNSLATPEGTAILVLQNFHRFLQSAEIVQALVQQIISRQAEPHVRRDPCAGRADSDRTRKAVRRHRARAARPRATGRDRPRYCHRSRANCRTAPTWLPCSMRPPA